MMRLNPTLGQSRQRSCMKICKKYKKKHETTKRGQRKLFPDKQKMNKQEEWRKPEKWQLGSVDSNQGPHSRDG